MPKLLVLRFSSIGDLVLTTPVIRALAVQTSYEVHILTKKRFAPVLAHNPYITKIHTFERTIDEVITYLKKEQYSFLIDLHKNLRSFRIRLALGVKTYDFSKKNIELRIKTMNGSSTKSMILTISKKRLFIILRSNYIIIV